MNKHIIRLLIVIFIITASAPAFAKKGWRLFAGTEEDFTFNPTFSVMAGVLDSNEQVGDAGAAYGLEASFTCSLVQSPENKLRQQLSYINYTDGDNSLQTVEANLHYRFDVTESIKLGVGPGIGYVRTDAENVVSNMLAAQLGGSLHYNINKYFVGAEYRYQITQEDNVGKGKENGADNWRAVLKLGYNFY